METKQFKQNPDKEIRNFSDVEIELAADIIRNKDARTGEAAIKVLDEMVERYANIFGKTDLENNLQRLSESYETEKGLKLEDRYAYTDGLIAFGLVQKKSERNQGVTNIQKYIFKKDAIEILTSLKTKTLPDKNVYFIKGVMTGFQKYKDSKTKGKSKNR